MSWFYKWIARAGNTDGLHTGTDRRRARLDAAVATAFTAARGLHGSPRLIADLRDLGWEVSEKTVADSMRRQGLVARRIKRRNGLTNQDRTAPKFPELVKRDCTASAASTASGEGHQAAGGRASCPVLASTGEAGEFGLLHRDPLEPPESAVISSLAPIHRPPVRHLRPRCTTPSTSYFFMVSTLITGSPSAANQSTWVSRSPCWAF